MYRLIRTIRRRKHNFKVLVEFSNKLGATYKVLYKNDIIYIYKDNEMLIKDSLPNIELSEIHMDILRRWVKEKEENVDMRVRDLLYKVSFVDIKKLDKSAYCFFCEYRDEKGCNYDSDECVGAGEVCCDGFSWNEYIKKREILFHRLRHTRIKEKNNYIYFPLNSYRAQKKKLKNMSIEEILGSKYLNLHTFSDIICDAGELLDLAYKKGELERLS